MGLTPEQRSLQARIAAHTRWAKTHDRTKAAIAGHDALLARFEREVDPDGKLTSEVRTQRAHELYRAHMLRLAAKSAAVRRARKQGS